MKSRKIFCHLITLLIAVCPLSGPNIALAGAHDTRSVDAGAGAPAGERLAAEPIPRNKPNLPDGAAGTGAAPPATALPSSAPGSDLVPESASAAGRFPTADAAPQRSPASLDPASDDAPSADEYAAGVFEEEGNRNLDAAMKSYRKVVAQFDSQRPKAANAIFRLAECYRKMNRMEEAKTYYARILREFPDQAQLINTSQRFLFADTPRGKSVGAASPYFQQRSQQIVSRAAPGETTDASASPGAGAPPPGTLGGQTGGGLSPGAGFGGLGGGGLSGGFAAGGGGLGSGAGFGGVDGGGSRFGGAGTSFGSSGASMGRMPQYGMAGSLGADYGRRSARGGNPLVSGGPSELEMELAQVKFEATDSKKQLRTLKSLYALVQNSRPEFLPEGVATDPRYQELKQVYERHLLNEDEDDQSQKLAQDALKRIKAWVEKIYVPELEARLQRAEMEYESLQTEVARLTDEVKAEAEKHEALLKEEKAKADREAAEPSRQEGGSNPFTGSQAPGNPPRPTPQRR